ncbi:MAG: hypothetical protein H7323_15230 [Frankiales bacterium]|nr:hypothetical protein [Frankiales bacterium]
MSEAPVLDMASLRRRVLLVGLVSMVAFFATSITITSTGLPDWLVLPAVVLLYLLVIRPLMAPVRSAIALRRAVAYQAFRAQQDNRG